MESEVAPLIADGAFSSVPTSVDCIFFVPHYFIDDQIRISTYSVGDESWKIHTFTCPYAKKYVVEDVVYMDRSDESFYCFNKKRRDCSHPSIFVHKSESRLFGVNYICIMSVFFFMYFYNLNAQFTSLVNHIALIPHSTMFCRI